MNGLQNFQKFKNIEIRKNSQRCIHFNAKHIKRTKTPQMTLLGFSLKMHQYLQSQGSSVSTVTRL